MSIVFLFDENPDVASAGLGGVVDRPYEQLFKREPERYKQYRRTRARRLRTVCPRGRAYPIGAVLEVN